MCSLLVCFINTTARPSALDSFLGPRGILQASPLEKAAEVSSPHSPVHCLLNLSLVEVKEFVSLHHAHTGAFKTLCKKKTAFRAWGTWKETEGTTEQVDTTGNGAVSQQSRGSTGMQFSSI